MSKTASLLENTNPPGQLDAVQEGDNLNETVLIPLTPDKMPRSKRAAARKPAVEPFGTQPLTRVGISELREHGGAVFYQVGVERRRIILTDRGREIGAIIPIADFRLLPPAE